MKWRCCLCSGTPDYIFDRFSEAEKHMIKYHVNQSGDWEVVEFL